MRRRAVRITKAISAVVVISLLLIAGLVYRQVQNIQRFFDSSRSGRVLEANIDGPLSGYYVDFSGRYRERHPFDARGVPLLMKDGETYYHPVLISEWALGAYEHFLNTGDTTAKRNFLIAADWLKVNLRRRGALQYWEYTLPLPTAHVPWVSALAQGEGASVLVRAYVATGDKAYLDTASKAIAPIFYDVGAGGASIVKGADYIFPQEYPGQRNRQNVLNGAIGAYFGVHDYYRVTKDSRVEKIDHQIRTTLRDSLGAYDAGYWSIYSQPPSSLASPHYQMQHVRLLKILHSMSGDPAFRDFAERFERQPRDSSNITKYVVRSHIARLRDFTSEDVTRVPEKLWRVVVGREPS